MAPDFMISASAEFDKESNVGVFGDGLAKSAEHGGVCGGIASASEDAEADGSITSGAEEGAGRGCGDIFDAGRNETHQIFIDAFAQPVGHSAGRHDVGRNRGASQARDPARDGGTPDADGERAVETS